MGYDQMQSINKLFTYLSIRKKLIIAFSLLSIFPLLVVGILGISHNISVMRQVAFENLKYDHDIRRERAENFFKLVGDDINFVAHSPSFKRFLNSINGRKGNGALRQAGEMIATFCQTKKKYYRFYFINRRHRQVFKVQQYGDGKYSIAREQNLARGHFPFYFQLIKNIKAGELVFVPVELATGPETQLSAISFASPIYRLGKFIGILVVDVKGKSLFDIMESRSILNFQHRVSIVNSEGFYVYDSKKKKDWNRLLASRKTINLFSEYAPGITDSILSGKPGVITGVKNEILTYTPLINSRFSGRNTYILMNRISQKYITTSMYRFAEIFVPVLVVFLALSVYFAMLATRQLITPIQQLQEEARFIAGGNYTHSFTVNTNDEIEDLAQQFNLMAAAIRDREELLAQQQANLENMVQQRTRQLQDGQNKIHAILNNVPSAFILYDAQGEILLASDAITSFLGISPAELVGKKGRELLWPKSPVPVVPASLSFKVKRPVMDVQQIDRPGGGGVRILEHTLLPVQITAGQKAALHIITDITEKRRLENHLIKIEKLVATGEMSAILAHELRNSVTSVKMILQLQLETSMSQHDRESLRVAIDSVLNMESILNNLLKFARPAPLRFLDVRLCDIIDDALIFMEPRLRKKQIELIKKIDEHLPLLHIDAAHLKEALINIILNAIQVLPNGGHIEIEARRVTLPKKMDDFGYDDRQKDRANPAVIRIVLPAGSETALIRIQDNGPGIAREHVDKIFDPFYTTKLNGTGLGLAMTKRVINQHNGIIRVKSPAKGGTIFYIYLPLEKVNAKTTHPDN